MNETTYDVRVWSTRKSKGAKGTRYQVRWRAGGKIRSRTLSTAKLADSFRSELITATRRGEPFDMTTGLPLSAVPRSVGPSWIEHAMDLIDTKWTDASPSHRKSTAEGLVTIMTALTTDCQTYSDPPLLRSALLHWAFNAHARASTPEPPPEYAEAIRWVRAHSRPLSDLADAATVRQALSACATRLDGNPAAPSVSARKRAALSLALGHAVERGHLDTNPLTRVKARRRSPVEAVDLRTVLSPAAARRLLDTIAQDRPDLHALFACMYYAGLRPSEARNLRTTNLSLPRGDGWGDLVLTGSYRTVGAGWTDSGEASEERELKHRARGDIRRVPIAPPLVKALRTHMEHYASGSEGRMFVTRAGHAGVPLAPPYVRPIPLATVGRVLRKARTTALTADELARDVARRPYDLRHACVSTWLAAGVPPAQVAAWAGHSVAVLLRVYAHALDGQEQAARARIEQAIAPEG